jgi:hypothetical protein
MSQNGKLSPEDITPDCCVVISLISASTKSGVISSGESLPFWLISARVLVPVACFWPIP